MQVKVSIIMPLYNSAAYMKTSINSILNQSYKEIELILVDDASQDDSLKIALQFKKQYPDIVTVISHKKNGRAGLARNDGIKKARGEYIWFVDADDWLDENAVKIAYDVAKQGDYDVVSSDYYEVDDENCNSKKIRVALIDECAGIMTKEKKNLYIVKGTAGFSKLIKRDFILKYNLFYPEGIMYEDNGIVPLFGAMADKVATIHTGLYYYRIGNPNSQTHKMKSEQMMRDRVDALNYLVKKSKEINCFDTQNEGIMFFYIKICYASLIRFYLNGSFEMSKEFYSEIRRNVHSLFPDFRSNVFIKKCLGRNDNLALFLGERGYYCINLAQKLYRPVRWIRSRIR